MNTITSPSTPMNLIATSRRRARWPIFGIVGAATGFVSGMAALTNVSDDAVASGTGVIDHIERGTYHASFVLGLVSVATLLVAATGWKRWAEQRAPRDLAARTIGTALSATATINVIFVSLAGALALYLPGGTDEGTLSREGIFVDYTLLDFGQLLGWWGALVAACCVVVLSLRTHRVLPRWMGIVSLPLIVLPLGIAVTTGLPGLVGLTMPIWLAVISIGMIASRTAEA